MPEILRQSCATSAASQATLRVFAPITASFVIRNGKYESRDYHRRNRESDDYSDRKERDADDERRMRFHKANKSPDNSAAEVGLKGKKISDRKDSLSPSESKNKRNESQSSSEKSKDSF